MASSQFSTPAAPFAYSASTPVAYPVSSTQLSPALLNPTRTTPLITESEGQAPEGTPLSALLCAQLGVPVGTIWGLPSGQRREDQTSGKPQADIATPTKAGSEPPSPAFKPLGAQV
jgi:hypothetical protein